MSPQRIFRAVAGLIITVAILLEYALVTLGGQSPNVLRGTLNFFSYFTILTNILAAAAMSAPALSPGSRWGAFFLRPGVRTAITLYMIVVALVYHLILAPLWTPQGWQDAANLVLHTVAPLLVVADWLFLTPKKALRFHSLPKWLVFPALFGVYVLLRGAIDGFYAYPFLDVTEIGYPQALTNIALLIGVFGVGGVGLIALGRKLPRISADRAA